MRYLLFCLFIVSVFGENWDHQLVLDPLRNYHLSWRINDAEQHITFQVDVKTKGWIGFGLSPNGGMAGSDIVIGWVKDGKTFFTVSEFSLNVV